ncbi:galactokinase [Acidobacteria bacterium AH-259-O06]|nr:galactokinase [Acidobacteria bacterium AH-259-O06]
MRTPGRVNLIGEHTDYNGLPVFPIAIQRDIAILFRARKGPRVRLRNVSEHFGAREFSLESVVSPYPKGDWGNYAKAAAQALMDRFGHLSGFDAVVSGNIPMAAGLSSSSALVVACSLILTRINEISIEPLELMDLLAKGERYVGTQGGGMDQAVCLGGQRNKALKIDFSPLRLSPIPVPEHWQFVIAHSLVVADKSGEAQEKYNARPVECREALTRFRSHSQFQSDSQTYSELIARVPVETLLSLADEVLEEPYRRRFRHLVSEGPRVEEARGAMLDGDLKEFGRLMNESHTSLRKDFEVSCPELDELVEACVAAGAAGARMTGAGFGGCAVTLCEASRTSFLVESLEKDYYRSRSIPSQLTEYLIMARPVEGASFIY